VRGAFGAAWYRALSGSEKRRGLAS